MHLIALHLNAILFSLVSASLHLSDVKYSSSNPRLPQSSSNTPIPNKLEIHVHGTLENLNIECLTTEKYRYHPSNTEYTPSPTGWHTVGICIMCILLVSVAWPLWKYLENNVQNGHLTRRAGRSEAVSGTTPREVINLFSRQSPSP
ncbi:hypothetical protein OPQ81_001891 [Rhizoctonia solani]|nr:hypothetical protein OPQ81_001891 [Rhizoctonia solani]